MGERRASWEMARAIAPSRNIFAPSIRVIAWYMAPAVAVRRSGASPLISHVPRASSAQETAATAIPKATAASPPRACLQRRGGTRRRGHHGNQGNRGDALGEGEHGQARPAAPGKRGHHLAAGRGHARVRRPHRQADDPGSGIADNRQRGQADSHPAAGKVRLSRCDLSGHRVPPVRPVGIGG